MEIPYIVNARKDTGLNNSKIAIWLFLASEVMLFGGLFSSYIFLRIFADYPWPERVLPVLPGLVNTFILIASSVTVVFAWASLKLRNWKGFVGYMSFTIVCALVFMVLKGFEYNAKLHHQAIQYNDWTSIEGHTHPEEHGHGGNFYVIKAEEVNFDLGSYYNPYLDEIINRIGSVKTSVGKDVVINEFDGNKLIQNPLINAGDPINLEGSSDEEGSLRYVLALAKESYLETRKHNEQVKEASLRQAWKNVKSNADGRFNAVQEFTQYDQAKKDAAIEENAKILESGEYGTLVDNKGSFKLAVDGAEIKIKPSWGRMVGAKEGVDSSISLLDKTSIIGKAGDSGMDIDVDAVDHRHLVMKARDRKYSQAKIDEMIEDWYKSLGDSKGADQIRSYWEMHKKWRALWTEELKNEYGLDDDGEPNRVPTDIELYRMTWKNIVAYKEIEKDPELELTLENVKANLPSMIDGFLGANHSKFNVKDDDGHVIEKTRHFPLLHVARQDIKFESVFSPKMNNYYAIYFTVTGLHGLHVIGGALVLGYYLFFGYGMYKENPEWLANRVEVGGLFWHFVDLVWIFVFPIFYLM
jgi:heme/copper-type cytochrome/quinol oxidase subunit 3